MLHSFLPKFSHYQDVPKQFQGAVVAIGNFDGLHLGHQALINSAKLLAQDLNKPLMVLSFNPHPRAFFAGEQGVSFLSTSPKKEQILNLLGVDVFLEQKFDRQLAGMSADTFVTTVLNDNLKVSGVVVGEDFHFGAQRQGTPHFLQEKTAVLNIKLIIAQMVRDSEGQIISSSRLRGNLAVGDVAAAARGLGYHYSLAGEVVHGEALGRKLGFPTANMEFDLPLSLAYGIYAIRCQLPDQRRYNGVASFGIRPTILDEGGPVLESYLFDFDEDIYGQICSISFFSWLRPEQKFKGLEPLKQQIRQDIIQANRELDQISAVSWLDSALSFS